MIGFSADIGRHLGDTKENCSTFTGARWSAAAVYIVGFWFLDFANNTVQVRRLLTLPGRAGTYANRSELYRHDENEPFLFVNLFYHFNRDLLAR